MRQLLNFLVVAGGLGLGAAVYAGELATDGGFEREVRGMAGPSAETWGRFASVDPMLLKIEADPMRKDNQVLRIEAREEAGAYQGMFENLPVKEGKKYLISVKVLNDPEALKAGSSGLLSVEWRDNGDNEIGRADGKTWSAEISGSKWTTKDFEVTAPPGATQAHFVILQRNPTDVSEPAGGAFLVDEFSVLEK